MNPLKRLWQDQRQAVWLDFIERDLLTRRRSGAARSRRRCARRDLEPVHFPKGDRGRRPIRRGGRRACSLPTPE